MADTLYLNDGTTEVLIGDNAFGKLIYEKLGREAELMFYDLVEEAKNLITTDEREEYEEKIEELEDEINELTDKIDDLKDKINELESELDDSRHEIECLEDELKDLRDRFED